MILIVQDFILDDFIWSFSRIETFERCSLNFYYKYIKEYSDIKGFFSQYGDFIHHILEKYALGQLSEWELSSYYKKNYSQHVVANAPPNRYTDLGEKYFLQGQEYFDNFEGYDKEILAVEHKYLFSIGKYKFRGILDLECPEEIIDIKTKRAQHLKRLTKRHNKEDYITMLDGRFIHKDNFKQLYIYSIPFKDNYGNYPKRLILNMARAHDWYVVEFDKKLLDEACQWVADKIAKIYNAKEFLKGKNVSAYWCDYTCGSRLHCKYSNAYMGDMS